MYVKKNNSNGLWGHVIPESVRAKISNSHKGKVPSEETRKKMSLSKLGERNVSKREDVKQKISASKLGKKRPPFSKEWRRRMSNSHKGKLGEISPNWQNGRTKLGQLIRSSSKYDNWRKEIFSRDSYACIIGGKEHGNKLEADHVKAFCLILRENNIKSLNDALNCEELWDIRNGRTLCVDCHKKTINYGNRSGTIL